MKLKNINDYLYSKIDELIVNKKLDSKRIILFGINTTSFCTKEYLEEKKYNIYAYIDNDSKKVVDANQHIDTKLKSFVISETYDRLKQDFIYSYSPEELLAEYKDDVVILIASKYYVQMCDQLTQMGYKENEHIYKTADFYDLNNVLKDEKWMCDMQELDIEEVKSIQLQILAKVKEICKENNLRYYLSGGSLLGAIRHKGYIPWDDDIDIVMPLPDYKKLIQLFDNEENYDVASIYNCPDEYYNFFMRVIDNRTCMKSWEYPFLMTSGVNIDIFPLIGLPDDDIMKFYDDIRMFNTEFRESFIAYGANSSWIVERRRQLKDKIVDMMERYPYDDSTKIGYILSKYREKEIMDRDIYGQMLEVEFEQYKFSIASGYEQYLNIIFGPDYMQLPSDVDRFTTHNYRAFKKEK